MVISGNTVMTHFLLGLDTFCLFHTPFRPVMSFPGSVESESLDLGFRGSVYCFPATANYLGGDIISTLRRESTYWKTRRNFRNAM